MGGGAQPHATHGALLPDARTQQFSWVLGRVRRWLSWDVHLLSHFKVASKSDGCNSPSADLLSVCRATPKAAAAAAAKRFTCISVAFTLQIWWRNRVWGFVDLEANTALSGEPNQPERLRAFCFDQRDQSKPSEIGGLLTCIVPAENTETTPETSREIILVSRACEQTLNAPR